MKKTESSLIIIFILAFFLRFILSFLPGLPIDMSAWYAWAQRLVTLGFGRFYDPDIWTHYTPGYLYILFILGKIKNIFGLTPQLELQLFKLPNNLADLVSAFLIYKIVAKKNQKWAFWTTAAYLFNPALIFNSSIWGQADSYLTLLLLSAFYYLIEVKNIFLSAFLYGLAFLVKPQAIFLFPVIFVLLIKQFKYISLIKFVLVFLAVIFLCAWPFFPAKPVSGLLSLIFQMSRDYPYTTLNAFNFWRLWGNWQSDSLVFAGISWQIWGFILVFLFQVIILTRLWTSKKKFSFYLAAFLSNFIFFLFLTRIHERYLLPGLIFGLIGAGAVGSSILFLFYIFLSIIHFANLYYVYCYYYPVYLKFNPIYQLIEKLTPAFSLLSVALFVIVLIFYYRPQIMTLLDKIFNLISPNRWLGILTTTDKQKPEKEKMKSSLLFLSLILIFAFLTRVINLWYPKAYIFDEVYHAFTAQEIVKGNIAAWEWWNSPPAGFAYEWTHPPLAKLFMALGIVIGQKTGIAGDFFWWRLPAAIFGTGTVYLTYLLAKRLTGNVLVSLLSAFFLSLEGLSLVMSRVGMNDTYFLFFLLLALVLALDRKWWLVGLAWGLSLASKWTAMYLLIPLFIIFAWQNIKKPAGFLRWLVVLLIAGTVYLSSYSLFFSSGHGLKKFWEVQQQMWWYHTRLKATHNYQSTPILWLFDVRPVWFYVNYQGNFIGNIYALGNPLIFWSGLALLPLFIYEAISRRIKEKLFVLLCYLIFWLPWIASPRIMFLYHYLPSLPFLALIMAWEIVSLRKVFGQGKFVFFWVCGLFLLSFVFFYPLWTGILLPKDWLKFWFWLPTWK